ncbi:unnamed protein product [Rhizoctonia solani]|nr:unnamed protein product [Rhizoctonia solani]
MYGTTQALIVAAIALQASANPVKLYERQVSSTSAPITSIISSFSSSLATPTITPVPFPEATVPSFPFPGSNGTYYICSFPSTNTTANSTEPVTSTATASTAPATAAVSVTLTDDVLTPSGASTSSVSASSSTSSASLSATKPVPTTSFSSYMPTATPTTFTVVGPSTTAIIECITVPTGAHPHPPSPSKSSSVPLVTLPTVTASILTSSVPTSSPISSIIQGLANEVYVTDYV